MPRSRRSESRSRSRSRNRGHRDRHSSKRHRRSRSGSSRGASGRGGRREGLKDRGRERRSRSGSRGRELDHKDSKVSEYGEARSSRLPDGLDRERRSRSPSYNKRDGHTIDPAAKRSDGATVSESKPSSMFEIMGKSGLGRRGDRSGADVHSISTSGLPRQPVWGNAALEEEVAPQSQDKPVVAEKANFGLTGALAKDVTTGNVYNGVVLKWSEPLDAANPDKNWRMYVFRGDEVVETLHLHRQSAYLVGREEKIADIKVLNPSCSKQHAVIQFRRVAVASADPEAPPKKVIKPYIMDLESTNKTFLNGTAIEPSRYIELREKDILKFGTSAKEYVLVCEKN